MSPGQESVDEYLAEHYPADREHVVSLLISQKMKWEADLRAQVHALRNRAATQALSGSLYDNQYAAYVVAYDEVLALLGGGSDE